jgi:6-pyruvoyltetrahydropterin/6-carboxytetrahydropterin synthase
MFGLVFTRRYSMAHRLRAGGSAKCAVPHGHNELVVAKLEATSARRLDGSSNLVELFEVAKARWHAWVDDQVDHSFHLSEGDPLIAYFREREPEQLPRLLVTPGDPTTEFLAVCFMSKLNAFLADDGGRLRCVEVRIEETPTNTVMFTGEPADFLPDRPGSGNRPPWWRRPDMSINDLAVDAGGP